jgi:hypothetical protein
VIAGEYMCVGRCRSVTARSLRTPCEVEDISQLTNIKSRCRFMPQSALYDNRRSAITTNAGSNLKTRQKISQGLRREYHTSNLSLVRIMGLAT